jgi:hypothetical protein
MTSSEGPQSWVSLSIFIYLSIYFIRETLLNTKINLSLSIFIFIYAKLYLIPKSIYLYLSFSIFIYLYLSFYLISYASARQVWPPRYTNPRPLRLRGKRRLAALYKFKARGRCGHRAIKVQGLFDFEASADWRRYTSSKRAAGVATALYKFYLYLSFYLFHTRNRT